MNKQICKYSIIRFQPYPETEEFANIGIVLYVSASKRLEFKLLDGKQHARITGFFDHPMCKDVFVQSIKIIRAEIERIKTFLSDKNGADVDLFAELIREREDIVRFSDSRVLYCTDAIETVDKLFEHYVHRSFAHDPGYDEILKRQVRDLLVNRKLGDLYKEGKIGEVDMYEVSFPFIRKTGQLKVIKPINFRREKPTAMIDKGHVWLSKVQQLNKLKFIKPEQVLFAYDVGENVPAGLFDPFNEIKDQARSVGIVMADIRATDVIAEFASH
ncbi:MAG: DUF3037 domain-containing protein [Methylococcales bacterium]